MLIRSLYLQNFRNYSAKKLSFTADKVIFAGNNGRGKTNILEALAVCSLAKSWREAPSPQIAPSCNLIQEKSSPPALIRLETDRPDSYQVQIFPRRRVFFKNDKKILRKNYLGQIPTLLFVPEHLEIFSTPKRVR